MKDQHKKITGYRDLDQEEIDLMNEAKALEAECLKFHFKVGMRLVKKRTESTEDAIRQDYSHASRWHAIARDDIETGFMALVRSIGQPQPKE